MVNPSSRGDFPALVSGLIEEFKASSRPSSAADAIASAAKMETRAASSDDAPPNLAVASEVRVASEGGAETASKLPSKLAMAELTADNLYS